jgi:hypothetical protein
MEDLKTAKQEDFAVIGYHPQSDGYNDPLDSFSARYQYYRSGSQSIPLSIIGGTWQMLGGIAGGNLYDRFLAPFEQSAALAPPVDIELSLENSGQVRVRVVNTSSSAVQGTLQIALVERHRPVDWRDMHVLDFICHATLPGPDGQPVTLNPSQSFVTNQTFSLNADWNYCSIVAFLQTEDKRIVQGAVIDIEDTFPKIQMQGGPETGNLWLKGSTHSFSWSSSRSLSSVVMQYSSDGGSTWEAIQTTQTGANAYSWTLPEVNSTRCLLAVRDPFSGVQAVSGLFAIGIKGDFNGDGAVNAADRSILVEHLTENRAALIPGTDLNDDGVVDLFDLIYFDANFRW